jgi:acyl-CoA synthetase (AMP-forming)/AMP-acid ligase II
MLPNIPEMVEAHFGIPMAGCVLNAINTRLDAESIAFMLNHGEAKLLIVDRELSAVAKAALAHAGRDIPVIDVDDPQYDGAGERIGAQNYESFIAAGDPGFAWQSPGDEWDAIALNYTSGTTGNPKGAVYHHRSAYLNAVSNILVWAMPQHPVYLWTLPITIATAGAFRGRWPRWRAPMCACARWMPRSFSTTSASTRSRTTAAHRSCTRCWSTPRSCCAPASRTACMRWWPVPHRRRP